MTIDIEGFKNSLVARGLKKGTIEFYIRSLIRLNAQLEDLTPSSISLFLVKLLEQGKSTSYVNDYVCALKQYAKWKNLPEILSIKFFKERPTSKSTLTDQEIEAFLSLPAPKVKRYTNGYFKKDVYDMWTVYFKILAYSGMRCGEAIKLTKEQIDFSRGVFILEDTKTNTPRLVPISRHIEQDLKDYIKNLKTDNLFVSDNGILFSDVEWGRRFHERLNRLGIKRSHLTPYSFRHSFITRLLEEDVNLFKVQKIVGHRRIDTTANYTHMTIKDTQKALSKDRLNGITEEIKNTDYVLISKKDLTELSDILAKILIAQQMMFEKIAKLETK